MKESASSSRRKSRAPRPRGMSWSARSTMRTIASGFRGSSTTTLHRERSAPLSSNDGFSVVAPTRTMSPDSMYGRKTSCCERLNRWISSRNRIVRRFDRRRCFLALSRTSRISLTPVATAEYARNVEAVCAAMRRASVVLPTPGGPQRTSEGTRSSAIARRRKPLPPTTASGPSTSSSERGRIRSASGVSGESGASSGAGANSGSGSKRSVIAPGRIPKRDAAGRAGARAPRRAGRLPGRPLPPFRPPASPR